MYRVKFSNLLQYTVSPWQSMRPRPKTEREELGVHQPSTTVVVHLAAAREPDAVTSGNDDPTLIVPIHSALPQPQPSRLPSVTVLSPRGQSGNLVPRPSPPQVSPSIYIFSSSSRLVSPLPQFLAASFRPKYRPAIPHLADWLPPSTSSTGRGDPSGPGSDSSFTGKHALPCPASVRVDGLLLVLLCPAVFRFLAARTSG